MTITDEDFSHAYATGYSRTLRTLKNRARRNSAASMITDAVVEDLAQSAWVRGWERRAQYTCRNNCTFTSWVGTIAWNLYSDYCRRALRRTVSLDAFAETADGSHLQYADAISDTRPESRTTARDAAIHVQQLAARYCRDERETQLLYAVYIDGVSYVEMVERFHIPRGSVASGLFHLLNSMRTGQVRRRNRPRRLRRPRPLAALAATATASTVS